MTNNPLDFISTKVSALLNSTNLKNLENPANKIIRKGLQDMGFVSFEDFETQREVLERLQEKVRELELRVASLEKQI